MIRLLSALCRELVPYKLVKALLGKLAPYMVIVREVRSLYGHC